MKNNRNLVNAALVSIVVLLPTGSGVLAQQSNDMNNMAGMKMAPAAAPAAGAAIKAGDLDLSGGYVKAMLPGQPVGGGYLTIHNGGSTADTLISVSSPAAAKVELHEMTMKDNIMRMRELKDGIAIAAGATVSLSPNTLHMMFKQVKTPFKQGGTVPVTLTFEKAGPVALTLPVTSAKGM
jgi:periplasmic copper chaperone A